jgi:porin
MDQAVIDNLVLFFRWGVGEEDVLDFDQAISAGVAWSEPIAGRSEDQLGFGVAWANPVDPMASQETLCEIFYRMQLTQTLAVSPDVQFVMPGGNNEDDLIVVFGVRCQWLF